MKSRILYEDKDIIVCRKPAGIATQTARVGQGDMVSEITGYLAAAGKGRGPEGKQALAAPPYVGVVHRLDQPVEGILVFAKNKAAAADLSRQATQERMEKDYYAVVCGQSVPERAELVDYLIKDGRTNLSRVAPREVKGAKEARLVFWTLQQESVKTAAGEPCQTALVRIRLHTGRHHQIRVQMANAGLSLLGDRKYADAAAVGLSARMGLKEIALCACRLGFAHPATGEKTVFRIAPEGKGFAGFDRAIASDMQRPV